jgi:aminoglycoside/choline kinase family phosphotransferase
MNSMNENKLSAKVIEMAAGHLGRAANEINITQLTGDASTRVYFRAQSDGASVIITLYGEPFDEGQIAADRLAQMEMSNPSARLTFASDPCAHIEVTGLFLEAGLPVPQLLSVSGADRVIFIEDVGDIRLQDWLKDRSESQAEGAYKDAVDLIGKIQEATGLALNSGSICSHLAFDEAKLRWELGFFFVHYFNRYLKVKLDPATSNGVQADFKALCSELSARPRVLTHRDYHARNLMMFGGQIFIIDHQDARMGPASYDLASLLYDPYMSISDELIEEMVERFIKLKSDSKTPLEDESGFRAELDMMIVQRMLKAIGTYSYQAAAMNNAAYVDYIKPAIERALAGMQRLDRFHSTRELLEKTRR